MSQRTIYLHSHYSVVFRNNRDALHFRTMAYQICPNDGRWLIDAFTDAKSKPYRYLVLDHHPSTLDDQTVVTNIFPGEQHTYYINSNHKFKRHCIFQIGKSIIKLKHKSNNQKVVKRTVKFLSVVPDSKVVQVVLQKAPDAVIRAISNAALNAR